MPNQLTAEQIMKVLTGDVLDFTDVQVERRGLTITLPPDMSYQRAIDWLRKRAMEEEREVAVNESMQGFPLDCAHALQLAVKERYGFSDLRSTPGMFGPTPPTFVNIPIDNQGHTTEVFVGRFGVPKLDAKSWLETAPKGFTGLTITGLVKARELPEIKALAELARYKLQTHSLYKGKAIRVNWEVNTTPWGQSEGFGIPTFMPALPPNTKLYVDRDTRSQIEAAIYTPISQTHRLREMGISLKQTVLLEGPFGTGKTLLAGTTAELCVQHEKTFIYLDDIQHLTDLYRLAGTMGGLVTLFAEDLDQLMAKADGHEVQNVLDGIDTKGSDIMLILTTNYPERLDTSILRHGRIDEIISFREPDGPTAAELVRHFAGRDLDPDTDLALVGDRLAGIKPASIRGVVDLSKRYALALHPDTPVSDIKLDTEALLRSATQMQKHFQMLKDQMPKPPKTIIEQLGAAFGDNFGKRVIYAMGQAVDEARRQRRGIFENGNRADVLKDMEEVLDSTFAQG